MVHNDQNTKILIVEDEQRYARIISVILSSKGYKLLTTSSGKEAIALAASEQPDLILLDVRLPDMDGFAICRRIREFSIVPVIMVTALAEEVDKVSGLEAGADDYITKPFSADELIARVHSALRRSTFQQTMEPVTKIEVGELMVDLAHQRVFLSGNEIALSPTEYRLIRVLATNAGRVLVAEQLLEEVWGADYEGDARLVWRSIHRLRQKIEADPSNPRYIVSRPGMGYLFERRSR